MYQRTNIKYDQKIYKNIKTVMIISFVMTMIFVVSIFVGANAKASDMSDLAAVILLITVLSENIGIPLFIISLVLYIDSSVYINRLKKNGFEVPLDKKDHQNDLSYVSRSFAAENNYAGDSKYLFIIFLVSFLICMAFDIAFLLKWYRLEADSAALFVFLVVFHLSFLIAAFVFLHQRDTGRYIDPVDIRDGI